MSFPIVPAEAIYFQVNWIYCAMDKSPFKLISQMN